MVYNDYMSDEVSFEENLPSNNGNSGLAGAPRHAPIGGFGGGYNQGPKKGLTQWLAENLKMSEAAASIIQVVFAVVVFVLAGFIFWSSLGK